MDTRAVPPIIDYWTGMFIIMLAIVIPGALIYLLA